MRHYNNFINEKKSIGTIQSIISKTLKELNMNFYFFATFGTALPVFFPIFEKLTKNQELDVRLSNGDIVLLIIFSFAVLFNENKEHISKMKIMLKEKRLLEVANKAIDFLTNTFELYKVIAKNFGKVVVSFIDLFTYTIIYVPFFMGLLDLIELYNIGFDNFNSDLTTKGFAVTTGIGVITIGIKHFTQMLMRKMTRLVKKKKEISNRTLETYESYISDEEKIMNDILDKGFGNLSIDDFELLNIGGKKEDQIYTSTYNTWSFICREIKTGTNDDSLQQTFVGTNTTVFIGTLTYKGIKYYGNFELYSEVGDYDFNFDIDEYEDISSDDLEELTGLVDELDSLI